MNKIAIYGAGGFGREVQMLIEQINQNNKEWEIIGYFDDGIEKGKEINGYKVLGNETDMNKWKEKLAIVFAIGNPNHKHNLDNKLTNPNIWYPKLIHPSVQLGSETYRKLGDGVIITGGCILTTNYQVGRHVILNLMCTVGHDAEIGDYCSIMPSVNVSGEVKIEDFVSIGTGVKIVNRKTIGKRSIIGAGAVVTSDIPPNCTAVGVPAKVIKKS